MFNVQSCLIKISSFLRRGFLPRRGDIKPSARSAVILFARLANNPPSRHVDLAGLLAPLLIYAPVFARPRSATAVFVLIKRYPVFRVPAGDFSFEYSRAVGILLQLDTVFRRVVHLLSRPMEVERRCRFHGYRALSLYPRTFFTWIFTPERKSDGR